MSIESRIRSIFRKTNWDALKMPHLQFEVVYSPEDNSIYVSTETQGSSFSPRRVWEGKDLSLKTFCYPVFDGNAPLEQHAYIENQIDYDVECAMEIIREKANEKK